MVCVGTGTLYNQTQWIENIECTENDILERFKSITISSRKKIIIQMEITIIATRFQNSLQRSITFKKLKQTFSSFIYILNLYFP